MTDQIMAGPAPTLTQFHVRLWPLLSIGGVCGLAWAAALRGFMAQGAGAEVRCVMGWNLRLDSASRCCHRVVARLGRVLAAYRRTARLALAGLVTAAICERAASGAPRSGHDVPGWHRWGSDRSAAVRHGRRICALRPRAPLGADQLRTAVRDHDSDLGFDCSGLWWAGSGGDRAAWRLGGPVLLVSHDRFGAGMRHPTPRNRTN